MKRNKSNSLDALFARYVSDSLTLAEAEQLRSLLQADPQLKAALDEYVLCAHLDGDVSGQPMEALLETRPALQDTLEDYREVDELLAGYGEQLPQFDFAAQREQISREIQRKQQRRQTRMVRWVIRPALAGLAAAAVFFLAISVYFMVTHSKKTVTPAAPMVAIQPVDPDQPAVMELSIASAEQTPAGLATISVAMGGGESVTEAPKHIEMQIAVTDTAALPGLAAKPSCGAVFVAAGKQWLAEQKQLRKRLAFGPVGYWLGS